MYAQYTHAYMRKCIYVYIYTYIYIYTYMYIYICMYIHAYMRVKELCLTAGNCVRLCVCQCVSV